jgi:hypothetical protein
MEPPMLKPIVEYDTLDTELIETPSSRQNPILVLAMGYMWETLSHFTSLIVWCSCFVTVTATHDSYF